MKIEPGDKINNRFEFVRAIDSGGFSDILLVKDLENASKEIAMKLIAE